MIIGFLENLLCMVSATRHRKRWLASIKLSKWEIENRARKARFPDNPLPNEPYVEPPCGGTGNHSDPSWPWYQDDQDDYESPFARATRLKEEKERARVYGWDKLERPTSIIER